MGIRYRWLAKIFAFFGTEYSIIIVITGLIVTLCVGMVIIGGIKRIASFAQVIVPFMAIIYIIICSILLIGNMNKIPIASAATQPKSL